jgi:hypothetical protein
MLISGNDFTRTSLQLSLDSPSLSPKTPKGEYEARPSNKRRKNIAQRRRDAKSRFIQSQKAQEAWRSGAATERKNRERREKREKLVLFASFALFAVEERLFPCT